MINYVQRGETLTLTANRTLLSGAGMLLGGIFGVATNDTTTATAGEFDVTGVFDLLKDANAVATVGLPAYWDNTLFVVTAVSNGAVPIGVFTQTQLAGDTTGRVRLNGTANTATTERLLHATYNFAVDGGAVGVIVPAVNFTAPANFVITNTFDNSTTAVTSGGSATIAVGTTAGSSATSLLAATAKTSFGANAFIQGVPVPQTASTFVKLSASGQLQLTVAVAALTAGVVEFYVAGYQSAT